MLEARAAMAGAIKCPHPAALERGALFVRGRNGRWMAVCSACSETMGACVRQWHAYSIKAATVYSRLRALEYSRWDAMRFVAQLVADRAKVRLGVLSREQVDV